MASDILSQAGKGSNPRNCWTPKFRSEHDRIFGKKQKRKCEHGKTIGDDCVECLKTANQRFAKTGT